MATAAATPVKYTDHYEFDSNVLSEGWYDSPSQILYLELLNGTRVGYREVPMETWFDLLDAGSAGAFWNHSIKHHFGGLNGDVQFVKRMESKVYTAPATPQWPGAGTFSANEINTFTDAQAMLKPAAVKWLVTVEVEAQAFADVIHALENGQIVSVVRA